MRKPIITLLLLSLIHAGCGGGAAPDATKDPSPNISPLQSLIGVWVASSADEQGLRYGLNFKNSDGSKNPASLDCRFFIVEVDGSEAGGLDGDAAIEGSSLVLNFTGFDSVKDTYSIEGSSLTYGGLSLSRIDGIIPGLKGTGTITGKLSLSSVQSAGDSARSFIPGQVLASYRTGFPSALRLEDKNVKIVSTIPGIADVYQKDDPDLPGLSTGEVRGSDRLVQAGQLALWTLKKVRELNSDPRVRFAQPNYISQPLAVPNDTHYKLMWDLPAISMPEAWDITTGSDNIIVAVVDTGVLFNHPDLQGRFIGTGYDFVDARISNDGDGPDPDPTDPGDGVGQNPSTWHGSHVSGTIGAATNNSEGIAGITWKGKVMPVRVLGAGGGTTSDIANGILYAAGLPNSSGQVPAQKADIMNLSLGAPGRDRFEDEALVKAIQAGVVVVAAAGNERSPDVGSPAAAPGVIAVSATGPSGQRAPYSNFGDRIDIAAPGGDSTVDLDGDGKPDGILSTVKLPDGSFGYDFMQGTSQASPHVAGVVALMLSVNPALTPAQVYQMITSTATDSGPTGKDSDFGFGLINAYKAVLAAKGETPTGPILRVSPQTVSLSNKNPRATVLVENAGAGTIDTLTASVSDMTGGNWLTASLDRASTPARLSVQASTQGLADGKYTGKITVSSSAGSSSISVSLNVGIAAAGPVFDIFVIALDPATGNPIFLTKALEDLSYGFPQIPVGIYYIIASTDKNHDGVICDKNELCGGYPLLSDLQTVPVVPDAVVSGADFSLGAPSGIQSLSLDEGEGIAIRNLLEK